MIGIFILAAAGIVFSIVTAFMIESAEKNFQKQLGAARLDTDVRFKQVLVSVQNWSTTTEKLGNELRELQQRTHLQSKVAIERLEKEYEFLKVHMYSIDKKTQTPPLIRVEMVPSLKSRARARNQPPPAPQKSPQKFTKELTKKRSKTSKKPQQPQPRMGSTF